MIFSLLILSLTVSNLLVNPLRSIKFISSLIDIFYSLTDSLFTLLVNKVY